MQKFLSKLITLLEVVIGVALLMGGVTGFFSYFLFNVLIGVMGFFILLDGLEKVDTPQEPSQPEHHHHGGGLHHRRHGEAGNEDEAENNET